MDIASILGSLPDDALLCDGIDDALIGTISRCGHTVALYSTQKALDSFMATNGWDADTALEWLEFNVLGAWLGEGTPYFLDDMS